MKISFTLPTSLKVYELISRRTFRMGRGKEEKRAVRGQNVVLEFWWAVMRQMEIHSSLKKKQKNRAG